MFIGDNFAANPASFTTSIPAATNLVIVGTALESRVGGRCPTAVTIGGAAATKIIDKDSDPATDWQSCASLWYRYNPATGPSVAIAVTWGATPTEGQVFVLALSGANGQPPAPAQGFSGVVDPPGKQMRGDLTGATSAAGSWCVASTSVSNAGTIANCTGFADQVLLQQSATTSQAGAFARRTIASAGAVSMCLTQSNITRWAMAEACFAPGAGAQNLVAHGMLVQGVLAPGGPAQPTHTVMPNSAPSFAAPQGFVSGIVPTCPTATVEADAPVSADYPSSNFGASDQLGAAASPAKRTFFRVPVSGVGEQTLASVRLDLTVDDVSGPEIDSGGRLHWIPDCAWDELTTTWDTQPDTTGAIFLDGKGAVAQGDTVSFDVTAAIAGDGVYCFVLDSVSTDEVIYRASEAASGGGPKVEITVDGLCEPATLGAAPANDARVLAPFVRVGLLSVPMSWPASRHPAIVRPPLTLGTWPVT
jgi:hypothetical protein